MHLPQFVVRYLPPNVKHKNSNLILRDKSHLYIDRIVTIRIIHDHQAVDHLDHAVDRLEQVARHAREVRPHVLQGPQDPWYI